MRQHLSLALFILLVFIIVVVYSLEKEPHKFSLTECSECHLKDRSGNVVQDQLTAPVTVLCRRCHNDVFSEGYMHPFDVKPRTIAVPPDFPLSKYGNITCATCHDIHASYFTPYGTPSHYLRRIEMGKEFCKACHRGLLSGKEGHKGTLGEAHFRSKYIATSSSQNIDPMSKNCISCHDGSFSASATIAAGTWSHEKDFIRHDNGGHPIGVDYEVARLNKGRKSDLKPMGMVDRRIRFFDGKVGCGSCHDPYSTIEKRLVMSDYKSRLCFACHNM